MDINVELDKIAKEIARLKERAMIYQVNDKEELAKKLFMPIDSYYYINYHDWTQLRPLLQLINEPPPL